MRISTGYGIDWREGFLAVARYERFCRGERTETLLKMSSPTSDSLATAPTASLIREAQRRRRALAVAAVPCREGVVLRLRVPLRNRARARRVLPSLLDATIPFSLEECRYVIPEMRVSAVNEMSVVAVVAPRDAIARRLEALRAAGFDPAILVSEGLALWIGSLAESPIHEEPDAARIVLYAGGDNWVGVGGLETEIRWAISAPPPSAGVDAAAVASACLPFLRRWRAETFGVAKRPLQWHWCGPALPPPEVRAEAERRLAADGHIVFAEYPEPASFLARSLARAAGDAGASSGQLRCAEDEHPDWASWRARSEARAWLGLATTGALLTAVNLAGLAALRRADTEAGADLSRIAADIAAVRRAPYGRELVVARAAVERRRESAAPFARAAEAPALHALATTLRTAADVHIQLHEADISDQRLLVTGTAARTEEVAALEQALRDRGWTLEKRGGTGPAFTMKGTRP